MESSTTSNNISSPLTLRWDDATSQYKVSKPNDQSGEYVDKKIADEMYEICKEIFKDEPMGVNLTKLENIIAKAEGRK
jgi:hypothetical protein